MNIEAWWPKVRPSTREWLIENAGDVVPADWIEAIANEEEPETPTSGQ